MAQQFEQVLLVLITYATTSVSDVKLHTIVMADSSYANSATLCVFEAV